MIHPVKILDQKGNVKKILSSRVLSQRHWKEFEKNPFDAAPKKKVKGRGRKPKKAVPRRDASEGEREAMDFYYSEN